MRERVPTRGYRIKPTFCTNAWKRGFVRFSVTNDTRPANVYKSTDNHDPDGSSSGSAILVTRP